VRGLGDVTIAVTELVSTPFDDWAIRTRNGSIAGREWAPTVLLRSGKRTAGTRRTRTIRTALGGMGIKVDHGA